MKKPKKTLFEQATKATFSYPVGTRFRWVKGNLIPVFPKDKAYKVAIYEIVEI